MREPARVLAAALMVMASCGMTAPSHAAEPVEVEMPPGATQCSFSAWMSFREEAPVPVRAGPSGTSAILGYLPIADDGDEDPINVEFDVVEARPGWLKIEHQTLESQDDDDRAAPSRPLFQGAGWIPAGAAQVGVQSALGYARPDPDSPLVIDLGDDWLTEVAYVEAIRACSGAWLLVDYAPYSERGSSGVLDAPPAGKQSAGTAWFRGVCSNQKTTCDMASVDRRP